uniref:M n=1 Tax=Dioscorea composita virus 1 TaxID=2793727 RepID=A0A8D9UIX8_9RHAB|nr:TPA_asm: M [Dioscorea composita virus 1]
MAGLPVKFVSLFLDFSVEVHFPSGDNPNFFPQDHFSGLKNKLSPPNQEASESEYLLGLTHWLTKEMPSLVSILSLDRPSMYVSNNSRIRVYSAKGLYLVKTAPNLRFGLWHLIGSHTCYTENNPNNHVEGLHTVWKYKFNDTRCKEVTPEVAERAFTTRPEIVIDSYYQGFEHVYEIPIQPSNHPTVKSPVHKHGTSSKEK